MEFDSLVFMAYIFGIIFVSLGTLMRFSFSTTELKKMVRLINAIKVIGLGKKTPDSFGMLMQFTGLLWLLFGTAYGIIHRRFEFEGFLSDLIVFLVLSSPPALFIGAGKIHQKYYWQNQK